MPKGPSLILSVLHLSVPLCNCQSNFMNITNPKYILQVKFNILFFQICIVKKDLLKQWFPTFWVLSPGILFYKQFWSHVASKLSEICHFVNFSGPAWTFFLSRWLGTSVLKNRSFARQKICLNLSQLKKASLQGPKTNQENCL